MNSFFLSVSFPRIRWQANCVFRSVATRKHNETLRLWPGSAEPCEAIGARVRTQVRIFNTCILCQILTAPVGRVWRLTHFYSVALLLEKRFACHHSIPYFFITLFPTAFYNRSRMTGRYLIPFCKKLSSVSVPTCPFRRIRFLFFLFKLIGKNRF